MSAQFSVPPAVTTGWHIDNATSDHMDLKMGEHVITRVSCKVLNEKEEKAWIETFGLASRVTITDDTGQEKTVRVWNASFGSLFGIGGMRKSIEQDLETSAQVLKKNISFVQELKEQLKMPIVYNILEKCLVHTFSDEEINNTLSTLFSNSFLQKINTVKQDHPESVDAGKLNFSIQKDSNNEIKCHLFCDFFSKENPSLEASFKCLGDSTFSLIDHSSQERQTPIESIDIPKETFNKLKEMCPKSTPDSHIRAAIENITLFHQTNTTKGEAQTKIDKSFKTYAEKINKGQNHSEALKAAIPLKDLLAILKQFQESFKDLKYKDQSTGKVMRFPITVTVYPEKEQRICNKNRLHDFLQPGERLSKTDLQTDIDTKLERLLYEAPKNT